MKLFIFCLGLICSGKITASIRCYNCHKDNLNCSTNPTAFYLKDCDEKVKHCYIQIDVTMVRGCFWHNSGISLRANARLCSKDGCNNTPFMVKSKLECQRCLTPNCPKEVVKCSYTLPLYRKDFCYSFKTAQGTLERGCLYAASVEVQQMCNPREPHRDKCAICQYNDCNEHLKPVNAVSCSTTVPLATSKPCELFTVSNHTGCFAKHIGNLVSVGCTSQMREDDFKKCATVSNSTCQLCAKNMCNANVPGTGLTTCAFGSDPKNLQPKFCNKIDDRCVMYRGEYF